MGAPAYLGKGVLTAINNIHNKIAPFTYWYGCDPAKVNRSKQCLLLDGSKTKSNLGANAILGVSLAVLGAAANVNRACPYIPICQ